MRRIRVIPVLLIDRDGGLVKTVRFGKRTYIGDPINAVKIYNDKGVDELLLLDIDATRDGRSPNVSILEEIVSEAFMPIGYGGGVTTVQQMNSLLRAGAEKIIINTSVATNPDLLIEAASRFGSQSVVAAIDVKKGMLGGYKCLVKSGMQSVGQPVEWAKHCQELGAGEIVLTSIDREGTYGGYDIQLLKTVSTSVNIPVVANGGARSVQDFLTAVNEGHCSAVAAASIFVYAAQDEGVLIRFPEERELESAFWSKVAQV